MGSWEQGFWTIRRLHLLPIPNSLLPGFRQRSAILRLSLRETDFEK